MLAPQMIKIAPVAHAQTMWPGIQSGIIFSNGTPGANWGCGKCSTPKTIMAIAKKQRPISASHRA
jgi:hypothetical protein